MLFGKDFISETKFVFLVVTVEMYLTLFIDKDCLIELNQIKEDNLLVNRDSQPLLLVCINSTI